MKRIAFLPLIAALVASCAPSGKPAGDLKVNDLEYFENQGVNVLVYSNLFTGGFPDWIGDVPEGANFWLQGNCLEGTVPEKVKAHPRWNAEAMDGTGRTIGEINMEQREGFVLK